MNSNTFSNRVEILLYSTLIAAMSGISHIRAQIQHAVSIRVGHLSDGVQNPAQVNDHGEVKSHFIFWNSVQEALVPLLLWVVLGFAAGYLIGMIRPR